MLPKEVNQIVYNKKIIKSVEIKKNKHHLSLWMIIYVFLVIYDPPILPQISFVRVLSVFSLIYILFNYRVAKQVIIKSNIFKFIIIYLVFYFYILLCETFNIFYAGSMGTYDSYVNMIISSLTSFGYLFILTSYIIIRFHMKGYNTEDLLITLIYVGLCQAVLTLLAFISPNIKSTFVELMSKNIISSSVISDIVLRSSIRRVYGFATNLFDMFGYSSSILITIALLMGLSKKNKYFIIALILVIMPVLNTRTGIVLTILGFLIVLFLYFIMKHKFLEFIKVIPIFVLIVIACVFLVNKVAIISPITYEWIQEGMQSTMNLFMSNEITGTYQYLLTDKFWFFPSGVSLIFGTGLRSLDIIGLNSDIGYVEMIWKFGILGSILIFGFFIKLFKDAYNASDNYVKKIIVIFLTISFFVYTFKLNAIGVNQASIIIFVICFKIMDDYSI